MGRRYGCVLTLIQNYELFRSSIAYRVVDVTGLCRWLADSALPVRDILASPATPGEHFTARIISTQTGHFPREPGFYNFCSFIMQNGKRSVWVPMSSSCHISRRSVGQTVDEILRFNGFQMMAVRHLGFLKFEISTRLQ